MQSQLTIRLEKVCSHLLLLIEKVEGWSCPSMLGMEKKYRNKARILFFFQFNNWTLRVSQLFKSAFKCLSPEKTHQIWKNYDFQSQLKVSADKKGQVLGLCSGLQDAFTFQGDRNICFSCYATKQRMNHHLCLAFGKKIFPVHGCQLTVHREGAHPLKPKRHD